MYKEEETMSKKETNKAMEENQNAKASRKEPSPAKKKMILNAILKGLTPGGPGFPNGGPTGRHF